MDDLFTRMELEERIVEIQAWIDDEKDQSAMKNLKTNLHYYEKLLRYYIKGFDDGEKEAKLTSLTGRENDN